jgi:uridine kinase
MPAGRVCDRSLTRAGAIESVTASHPLRVAVDGPPAAGKTTLADELALLLRTRGREVIRASIESFHLPRAQRYRRGEFSPEANHRDSFDYDTLCRVLLDPLGPDGDRRYQHAVYDFDTDTALSPPVTTAPADAVLLLDGVFLLRPELIGRWDLSIFVSAEFGRILDRARIRDLARLGSAPKSSGASVPATSPPRSSTSPRPARPITPTSSCTTMSPGGPPGKPDRTDPHTGLALQLGGRCQLA